MKKILLFVSLICLSLLPLFVPFTSVSANAANILLGPDYTTPLVNYITEFSQFKSREPGSDGEALAASFIKSKLDEIASAKGNLAAVNNASTTEGVQTFDFNSSIDGLNKRSQNIIYRYTSPAQTDKKLIIGCNYDNVAYKLNENYEYVTVESEGINGSAASVAALLLLAEIAPTFSPDYNIEFIFFGAGLSNQAGSKFYSKGILPETKDNILAMINLDNIAVGENLYFYVDEVDTKFSSYVSDYLGQTAKKVDTAHLGKVMSDYPNELGLDYMHVALDSDNKTFMSQGILTVNLFAGDYEMGIVYGKTEYLYKDNVIYTENDNQAYIRENYEEWFIGNTYNAFASVLSFVYDENFVAECLSAKNQTELFYKVFGNQQIIAYISAVVLIVLIAIAIGLHFKLQMKSYEANIEPEFLTTVISISEHIDETMRDENVPKAVSQVIAHDIKKDKTIKPDKKKKDQ